MQTRDPKLVPFVLATPANRAHLRLDRLPPGLAPAVVVDPQAVAHGELVRLAQHLDDLTFGPLGLHMPGWVFYDCAVMPGAIFGFGASADQLKPWVRRVMGVADDYDGLVPLSLFIAIAMLPNGAWLVYSLTTLNLVAPGSTYEGLLRETLAAGLALLPIGQLYATVQWRSPTLPHYTALGPLEVLTAWTPAHDIPSTLTFRVPITDAAVAGLLAGDGTVHPDTSAPNRLVEVDRTEDLKELQALVERGVPAAVVAPPARVGRYTMGLLRVDVDSAAYRGAEATP